MIHSFNSSLIGILFLTVCSVANLAIAQSPILPAGCLSDDRQHELLAVQDGAGERCEALNLLGRGPAVICTWLHDFRAQSATEQFARLATHLEDCMGQPSASQAPVNHPDTIRQMQFSSDGVWISLTLKDKAVLKRTLISLTAAKD